VLGRWRALQVGERGVGTSTHAASWECTTVNIVTVAPMPRAMTRITIKENPGGRSSKSFSKPLVGRRFISTRRPLNNYYVSCAILPEIENCCPGADTGRSLWCGVSNQLGLVLVKGSHGIEPDRANVWSQG
jgi:hypothetical protein